MGGMNKDDVQRKKISELIGDIWEQKVVSTEDVKILVKALDNDHPNTRSGAVIALGNIFSGEHKNTMPESTARMMEKIAVDKIKELQKTEKDEEIKKDVADVLEKISKKKPGKTDEKKMPSRKRQVIKTPDKKALPMKAR